MNKGKLTAADCHTREWMWRKKRERLKKAMMEKYNWKGGSKNAPREYTEAAAYLTDRICTYKEAIRKLSKRNEKIRKLYQAVEEFTSMSIKTKEIHRLHPILSQGIYMKYGMEHGLYGTDLAAYMGVKNKDTRLCMPSMVRTNFTKSFATNPQNRELYHRFIEYMNEPD